MNPMSKDEGLVPSRSPASMIIPCLSLAETIGTMTDACLEAGLTFLHDKAISCRNAYVTVQVQAVASRFQEVPKHSSSIPEAALLRLPPLQTTAQKAPLFLRRG